MSAAPRCVAGTRAAGVVLAAGKSERMGEPKALLRLRSGETFLARAIAVLREAGIERIVVVANPATREAIASECVGATEVIVNPRPEDGMISSIRLALDALANDFSERVIATLVDIPDARAEVVTALLEAELDSEIALALPRFDDGPGHPVMLLPGIRELLSEELPRGLKTIMERRPARVAEIRCAGLQPWDVDTPRDYARVKTR